jgi:hypothetical protein
MIFLSSSCALHVDIYIEVEVFSLSTLLIHVIIWIFVKVRLLHLPFLFLPLHKITLKILSFFIYSHMLSLFIRSPPIAFI